MDAVAATPAGDEEQDQARMDAYHLIYCSICTSLFLRGGGRGGLLHLLAPTPHSLASDGNGMTPPSPPGYPCCRTRQYI
jgi:hypothetical protein